MYGVRGLCEGLAKRYPAVSGPTMAALDDTFERLTGKGNGSEVRRYTVGTATSPSMPATMHASFRSRRKHIAVFRCNDWTRAECQG